MKAADKPWNDMRVLVVVVVTWSIQDLRHHTAITKSMALAILAVVAITKLDAGNLRNGLGLVGRL